jgi:hypothetical protein
VGSCKAVNQPVISDTKLLARSESSELLRASSWPQEAPHVCFGHPSTVITQTYDMIDLSLFKSRF